MATSSSSPAPGPATTDTQTAKRRFAVVGTGSRARLYTRALTGAHAHCGSLVALCDSSRTRMRAHNAIIAQAGYAPVPTYSPGAFTEMLEAERVDEVICCTIDRTHADYIEAALRAGRDVLTEKPMTADLEGCRRIHAARQSSTGRVTVGFNYRYNPVHQRVRELVAEGTIGDVGSVHFEWLLDLRHGADYFRRWHRDKRQSGGLLVHKASHHFDLVNWWIGARPEEVFAWGDLFFYGEENGRRRGLARDYERSHGDTSAETDPFAVHLDDSPDMRALYLDAEHEDGYRRDLNVFGPGITIEDDMSALVRYDSGAKLSYHLAAYSPWEGYRVAITGSRGRLELDVTEFPDTTSSTEGRTPVRGMPPAKEETTATLLLRRHWRPAETVPVATGPGSHGGGDTRMLEALLGGLDDDTRADHEDGSDALLTGLAANASIASGRPERIPDLLERG